FGRPTARRPQAWRNRRAATTSRGDPEEPKVGRPRSSRSPPDGSSARLTREVIVLRLEQLEGALRLSRVGNWPAVQMPRNVRNRRIRRRWAAASYAAADTT